MIRVGPPGEEFINRRKELEEVKSSLIAGQSWVFIAPRRYGKTSLMLKLSEELKDYMSSIYIDINLCTNLRSLGEEIINAVYSQAGLYGFVQRAKERLSELLKSVRRLKLGDFEVEPGLEALEEKDDYNFLRRAIELPEKTAERWNKRFLVMYDEFSEVVKLHKDVPKLFRSLIQFHKHCVYIFAGSQESMMKNLFVSSKGVFFKFARSLYLDFLEEKDCKNYIKERLKANQKEVERIVEITKCHPYYLKKLLHIKLTREKASLEEALRILLEEERHYLELLMWHLKEKKYRAEVVRILSCGENPYELLKGVIRTQQINQILRDLEFEGVVRRRARGKYELTDPLLALYLCRKYQP